MQIVKVDSERLIKRKAEINANILKSKADLLQMGVEETTLKSELDLAYENVKLAESDVDRHEDLVRKKSISPITLSTFRQTLVRQKTIWQQLKSRLDLIPAKKEAIQAGIKAQEANLELIERDIKDTSIKAPFKGILMDQVISAGDYVRKGDVVCMMYDPGKVEIWIPIGVSEKNKLGEIKRIKYNDLTTSDYRYLGAADRELQSDTMIFNLSGTSLKAGELIKCRVDGQTLNGVMSLPETALRDDRQSVYKVVDGKLKIQNIDIALTDKSRIYVRSGVNESDEVVTNRLRDVAEGTNAYKEGAKKGSNSETASKKEKGGSTGGHAK